MANERHPGYTKPTLDPNHPCCECGVRTRWGTMRRCKVCHRDGPPDRIPMPADMDAKVQALARKLDPLAIPRQCQCGRETSVIFQYDCARLESVWCEVCPEGHITPARKHGVHTYDQRDRAEEREIKTAEITAKTKATKHRNGKTEDRSRNPFKRGFQI